jgi:hypothetical protein
MQMETKDMNTPEQEPDIVGDVPPVASSTKKKVILVGCGFCVLLFLVYAGIGLPRLAKVKPNVQESSEKAKAEEAAREQLYQKLLETQKAHNQTPQWWDLRHYDYDYPPRARVRVTAEQAKQLRLKGLVESLETYGVKVFSQADVDEARALAEELEALDMIARLDKFELEVDQYKNMSAKERQDAYAEEYRRITIEIDKLSLEGALITNDKLNEVKGDLELLQDDYSDIANKNLIESRLSQIADLRTQMNTNTR